LSQLSEKVELSVQRIHSNESLLNAALSEHSEKIKSKGEIKHKLKENIKVLSEEVQNLSKEHETVKKRCDKISEKIKEITDSSTNDKLVLTMRRRIEDLRQEIKEKDLRIGVLSSVILNRQNMPRTQPGTEKRLGNDQVEIFVLDEQQMEELI
jgi:predicted RNase H-like nuclease (RuvC/YqgF family)